METPDDRSQKTDIILDKPDRVPRYLLILETTKIRPPVQDLPIHH